MNETELLEKLVATSDLSEDAVRSVLNAVGCAIAENGFDGVSVPGLGHFAYQPGETYEVVNPGTGKSVTSESPPTLVFSPSGQMGAAGAASSPGKKPISSNTLRVLSEIKLQLDSKDAKRAGISNAKSRDCKTKLGGEPDWIQSPDFPECCGASMTFFGQLDSSISDEFNIADSGIVYVFVCDRCSLPYSTTQFY